MQRTLVLGLCGLLGASCGDDPTADAAPAADRAVDGVSEENEVDEARTETKACPEPRVPLVRRMSGTIAEACRSAVANPTERSPEIDGQLQGRWSGEYDSSSADPVTFTADLTVHAGTIAGSTTEPNTFPYIYGYTELEADLLGDAYGSRQVVWMKTYRTGSVSHSVLYVGTLDEAGKRIEGHWRLGGSTGTFWLTRE